MHEQDLITGLVKGDQQIFRKLIEQYGVSLTRLCRGFLHNDEDARDIVQDTFIEVYESIANFRADSKFSTWIYRIAVNKSLNLLRKNRLRRLFISLDAFHKPTTAGDPLLSEQSADQPGNKIEQQELKRRIRSTIDSLPENQRIAFILNKYQELSYSEVAEVMGITLSSVESLIHRARINLQKKLSENYKKNIV